MTTVTVFCMAVAYSVTAGLDARSTPSCRFTSERRGLSSHLALIRFVQHPLCLRFVSRLSSATDSDKLAEAHEAKKKKKEFRVRIGKFGTGIGIPRAVA